MNRRTSGAQASPTSCRWSCEMELANFLLHQYWYAVAFIVVLFLYLVVEELFRRS